MMKLNRRDFIKQGGALSTGLAFSSTFISGFATACEPNEKTMDTIGIQLYTLRDVLPKDPKGVLEKLASFGYKQIESYAGASGIFWGMTNKEFKKYMDDLGMTLVSSHCNIGDGFEQLAAEAGEIGVKYLICPWIGPQDTLDDFRRIADDFNAKGEICRKNGLRFAYHNHAYSFEMLEGKLPQVVMIDNTNPELVDFQLDLYWVVTAGQDPREWLRKYKSRVRLCHVKDRQKGATKPEATCTLGTGSIDYSKILATAESNGMEYYIVEQEHYENTTPLDCARDNITYLQQLKITNN